MKRSEEAVHRQVVSYLRVALPSPWLFWHTANGMGRSKAEAGILKALGVRAGIPDLILIGPERRMICIEFKAPKPARSSLSPAQKDTINALGELGVPTIIVRSLDEAERALRELGVPLKGRAL